VRSHQGSAQVDCLVRRLLDLEVGDAIIDRYPEWLMAAAKSEIGGLATYQLDRETNVLTCTFKKFPYVYPWETKDGRVPAL
jgi:hypothetical protein